jgi:hypothetical protein
MKYHIDFLEERMTKVGPVLDAQVTDENGIQNDKVSLWPSNWPNFRELKPGSDVLAELKIKQNGKFTNKTLYPEKTDTRTAPRAPSWAGGKSGAVAAAKETSKNVAVAQENKQEGIKISSTFRDATLITIAFFAGASFTEAAFKEKWMEVRNWLWKNFDTSEDKESAPF